VATGGSQEAAEPGRLRASDADREQALDLLKAAFTEGLLTRDELVARAGSALTARTYADLAGVTAGIPAGVAAGVAAASPRAPAPARARRRPGPQAKAGACLIVATVIMIVDGALTGGRAGPTANLFYVLSIMTFVVAFIAWLCTLSADRGGSPAGQPPQGPAPAGHDEAATAAAPAERRPPARQADPGGTQATRAAIARPPVRRTRSHRPVTDAHRPFGIDMSFS